MTNSFLNVSRTETETIDEGNSGTTPDDCRRLIAGLTSRGAAAIQSDADLRDQLIQAVDALTARLRWNKEFDEAIALQESLLAYLPDDAVMLQTVASTLRVEAGDETAGFRALRQLAEQDTDDAWGWIALGSACLWAGRHEEAEFYLRRAADLGQVEALDRAEACLLLFRLYGSTRRVDEAVAAWEQATQLNPELEANLPDLLRMLIHWYYFDLAQRYVEREHLDLRRGFYQNLIDVKRSPVFPRNSWEWVMKHDPTALTEAHDEYAEACLRYVKPQRALDAIEPFIDQGDLSRRRLVLAGLAWAQLRMIDRATWALDLALRAGDLERPRGTRRSTGGRRILDTESRVLYGEIIVDSDIREEVDRFFMPVVEND